MKKTVFGLLLGGLLMITGLQVNAQVKGAMGNSYQTALGLRIDFGRGSTGFGFNGKHYLSENTAIDANLIFFDGGAVGLGGEYQFTDDINGAEGLKYYAGIGPNFIFGNGYTDVQLRPVLGVDYKISGSPINFAFDWRPMFTLNDGTHFTAGRFGFSVRYAFK